MEKIVEGKIEIEDKGRYINISKQIYVNCDCNSLEHIGRWVVDRSICKDNGHEEISIYYENNAITYIKSHHYCYSKNKIIILLSLLSWFLKTTYNRIILSLKILFKSTVFIPTDFVWSYNTIECFKQTITNTIEEIKFYKTGFENINAE